MKHLMLSLLLLIAAAVPAIADEPKQAAEISFRVNSHEFGYIKEDGGPISYNFVFTNTGNAPLIIYNVRTSCGCAHPEFPKNPIQAGQTDSVKVTYIPRGRPGAFDKVISVKSNGGSPKLRIKGVVIPAEK